MFVILGLKLIKQIRRLYKINTHLLHEGTRRICDLHIGGLHSKATDDLLPPVSVTYITTNTILQYYEGQKIYL